MAKPILFSQRSGRFNVAATPIAGITISSGIKGALYRILNSGTKTFKVPRSSGDANPLKVLPRQSVDVGFSNALTTIKIIPNAANDPISGIYDLLPTGDARSGRFTLDKVADATVDPAVPTPIIDLTFVSTDTAYRFFNSGFKPIQFRLGPNVADPVVLTLNSDQSIDWKLDGGATVYVSSAASADPISGSYDLIGAK